MMRRRRGNVLVYARLGSQGGVKPENNCGPHALDFVQYLSRRRKTEKHTSMK